ncbi:hypothetical protein Ndes2526B_g03427 [Nannochloris sp. 'desiccata']|nr:hypothetical protein KSW81_006371 [Chlorella desiccata (nom. nud.)]
MGYSSTSKPCCLLSKILWAVLILQLAAGVKSFSLGDLFGSDEDQQTGNVTSVDEYGSVMVKTMQALRYLEIAPEQAGLGSNEISVPYGNSSYALVRRDGLNSLYVAFQDNELGNDTENWATNTQQVPFLHDFVYTAEAPAAVVSTFSQLVFGTTSPGAAPSPSPRPSGHLTQAIETVMAGERILWVTCTGKGPSGGLAVLCGLAAALHFPRTSVDVITFATPWQGFNPQLAWSFDRLISLYYFWPFDPAQTLALPANTTGLLGGELNREVKQVANGLKEQITAEEVLKSAVTIPNLPASLPEGATELEESNVKFPEGDYDTLVQACYDSFANQTYGGTPTCFAGSPKINNLTSWAPAPSLPPPGQLPPESSCPPIICRTLPYLDMSCTAFMFDNNATSTMAPPSLGGLPFLEVQDQTTSGDAIVAWNDTSKEAIFLFKFTEESRDWAANTLAYKTDNFRYLLDEDFPAAAEITAASEDPQVHAGFFFQFQSLLDEGDETKLNLTTALNQLNGGQTPLFIAVSGFSLGGALSELAAVWASYKWPRAHILVATQGAPKVGNEDFVTLYKATAGVAWRFQFNLDEVPAIPPLAGYRTTREPIWITREGTDGPFYVLLEPRPEMDLGITTWYDHWCEALYIPVLRDALAVAVPNWVYAAPAAERD